MAFRCLLPPLVLLAALVSACVSTTARYHEVYRLPPVTVHVADLETVRAEFAARSGKRLPVYGWINKQTLPGSGEVVLAEIWTVHNRHENDPFAQLVLGHEVGHLIGDMSDGHWFIQDGPKAQDLGAMTPPEDGSPDWR